MSESTSFAQLFMGLFLITTGVHASCPIELRPPIVVVQEGKPVLAVCSATGEHEGIGWEAPLGGVPLQGSDTTNVTWTLDSLKEWADPPTCFINPVGLNQCSKDLTVVLYTFPENISMHRNSSDAMIEYEEYTFTCDIPRVAPVQNLTVKWYNGDTVIHTDAFSNDNKHPVNQSVKFRFSPTEKDNGTRLRCEAHMDLRPEGPQLNISSEEHHITVLPSLTMTCPSTYTVQENEPPNLTCTVDSYFDYEVIWYKDEEVVNLLERLIRSDAGQYSIVASNPHTSVNRTVDIIVKYPPSSIAELEDSEVSAGSDLRLKCSSTSNPRPTYSWDYYRTDNVNELNEDGVTYLLIHNATGNNMGSYTCRALNDAGSVSKTVRVTVIGAEAECPIDIAPDTIVTRYQDKSQEVTCKSNDSNLIEMYWEPRPGTKMHNTSWFANTSKDWGLRPACVATFTGLGTCRKVLNFTLYKPPDSFSILGNSTLKEGTEMKLRCEIINIAPVQHLTVLWHTGNDTTEGSMNVPGCEAENITSCNITSPVNVTYTINMTRSDNGKEFVCEARMNLALQNFTNVSSPFKVTVLYPPVINTSKLGKEIPVFRGYPEELVCEADGSPPPNIQWSSDKGSHESGSKLTVTEAGAYNCTARNRAGSTSHVVHVILKEDYLPLIAGFVAVTVVAISIIFLCIYSIYYKNTKMRRYSLKNPNFSTQNGNVAHNGWEVQFPMNKLP